jgi:bifunctional DNA-binding transcriptional regulator/antitoxin component of YhaV-PrlF toxin-antitoxin module
MPSKRMTTVLKEKNQLVVPPSVQRRAGIKTGDRLQFQVAARSITITAVEPPAYKPTKAEWAAMRKGEAAIASGDSVPLTEFLHGLDSQRRKTGSKASRKIPR